MPDIEPSYIVWHTWLAADGYLYAETGHYDLSWEHAQRVLLDRAGHHHQHAAEVTITTRAATVATTTVSGHPVALRARCDAPNYLRIDLLDAVTGQACGTADCLDDNAFHIDLPTEWSSTDRSRVTCLITQVALFRRSAP